MKNRFNFKSIFIAVILIAFTTTVGIAAIGTGLNLLNGDLNLQEQSELDKFSANQYQSIGIYSGETKLISFPRKIETINFSKDSGFSIRTLIGGEWIDMSNNPDDYEIMQGYIVRNFGSEDVYIQVKYAAIASSDQTLYQKELKAGWNLYAPAVKNDYCNAVNVGDSLNGTNYSQIIDFSSMGFKKSFSNEVSIDHIYSGETLFFNKESGHPQKFREDGNYTIKNSGDVSEDFIYEGGAYGVFVNNDTLVSGNQNITDSSGRELIKYNNHPVIVFQNNLNTELNITDTIETELLNFDFTSKYNGTDDDGTSSILATLSLIGTVNNAGKITDNFNDIKVKIDGVEKTFSMNSCNMLGDISKCNYGNLYLHLDEPELITRGHTVNVSVLATPKNNIKFDNYNIKLDKGNTLILDDQNLLPYCNDGGFILGTNGYQGRNINIDTTVSGGGGSDINPIELAAAQNLAGQGVINGHGGNDSGYELGNTILRQDMSVIFRKVAGLELKNTCDNRFTDISSTSPNEWVCSSVEALFDNGFLHANAEFRPLDQILKIEALELALKTTGTSYVFNTGSSVSNNEQIVNFAVEQGITNHFTDYQKLITKGEIYVFIVSAQDSINEDDDILTELECLLSGNCDNGTGSTHTGSTIQAPKNVRLGTTATVTQGVFWDTVEGAESYRIDYYMSGGLIESNTSDSGYITLHHLYDNTDYTAQVFAIGSGTTSIGSELIHFKTLVSEALAGPENIILNQAYTDKLELSWDEVATASGYRVMYITDGDIVDTGVDTNTNSIVLEYLKENSEYNISIQTINSKGNTGGSSSNIKFTTLENIDNGTGSTNTGTTLGLVGEIRLLNSSTGSLSVEWDEVTNASNYNVKLGLSSEVDNDGLLNLILSEGKPTTETAMFLDGLEVGTEYSILIAAYSGNKEVISEEFRFTTQDNLIQE